MSQFAPKPIIAETVQTWKVAPGMIYALVRDLEKTLWVVESCPAGTHFWTLAQAQELPSGNRTRAALTAAVREGLKLEAAGKPKPNVYTEQVFVPQPAEMLVPRRPKLQQSRAISTRRERVLA